jgi:hypothetical protein
MRDRLLELFRRETWAPLPEEEFNDLAMDAFRFQVEKNPVYGRFVEARGGSPGSIDRWTDIPMVPTTAFKRLPLVCGDPASAQAVFRTSGTTSPHARGVHYVLDLDLYHGALLPNFRRHLLPEGGKIRILSLVPDAGLVPESSLGHMMKVVAWAMGDGDGGFFAGEQGLPLSGPFQEALARAVREGTPVLVAGTAFAVRHWLDVARESGFRVVLPPGSRVMETGGFKGRSREVPREGLYRELSDTLGVPISRIVNEYGMTEMCSQFYEPVLVDEPAAAGEGAGGLAGRRHVPPPWVRTQVLDPVTLETLGPGGTGILAHFDLSNLGSVCHLLTEDLGVATRDGFRLLGRTPGSEPRGCSLTMEALMESQRSWTGG